jgi:hypothetical protein
VCVNLDRVVSALFNNSKITNLQTGSSEHWDLSKHKHTNKEINAIRFSEEIREQKEKAVNQYL